MDTKSKKLVKIALTGGPCSGKTTVLSRARSYLEGLGVRVIAVPEAATLVFDAAGREPSLKKEYAIVKTQLALEDALVAAVDPSYDTVILCDRGILDCSAYNTKSEWDAILSDLHLSTTEMLQRYDAVIHLVTAAIGAPQYYKMVGHRTDSPDAAASQDNAIMTAYLGHGHQKIVDNSTDFETKIRRVLTDIGNIVGIPKPLEIERKFVVILNKLPCGVSSVSHISQFYMNPDNSGDELRVRSRLYYSDGKCHFTKTVKSVVSDGIRIENECAISGSEYVSCLGSVMKGTSIINKERTCFVHRGLVFELDRYLGSYVGLYVLEVEVSDLNQPVTFPDWLRVVEEVTGDPRYSNYNLSLLETQGRWTLKRAIC